MKMKSQVFFLVLLFVSSIAGYGSEIDIHGFLSQGFMKSTRHDFHIESQQGTFQFNETGVNFSTDLNDDVRFGMQLLSRDFGRSGNNKFILDWGYADYRKNDNFGICIGKIRLPLGLYSQIRDFDILRSSIFLPQVVYDEQLRSYMTSAQGISCYGTLPLHESGNLEYEYVLGSGNGDADEKGFEDIRIVIQNALNGAIIAGGGAGGALVTDPSIKMKRISNLVLRWNTPVPGLRLLYSLHKGVPELKYNTNLGPYTTFIKISGVRVLSAEYLKDRWSFVYEQNRTRLNYNHQFPLIGTISADRYSDSYYYQVSHRFSDHFSMGSYYGIQDFDVKSDNETITRDVALTLCYEFDQSWCMKIENHWIRGTIGLLSEQFLDDTWNMYAIKTSYNF